MVAQVRPETPLVASSNDPEIDKRFPAKVEIVRDHKGPLIFTGCRTPFVEWCHEQGWEERVDYWLDISYCGKDDQTFYVVCFRTWSPIVATAFKLKWA